MSGFGKLLVYAAEVGDTELTHSLCNKLDPVDSKAVIRALAITSGAVYDLLEKRFAHILGSLSLQTLTQIQVTAQTIGSIQTSKKLMAKILSLPADDARDQWFSVALH